MKVLVIGSGGREHTLCWKLGQSSKVKKVYCAPGNGGTGEVGENIEIAANDIDSLLDFAIKKGIDLTVVGPEGPLVLGIVDRFKEKGLKIFGANKAAARLEGSKEFSKTFMEKYEIPTARYKSFSNYDEAVKGLKGFDYPLVIKADGLCFGKGVVICNTKEEAIQCLEEILVDRVFGEEGSTVIIEEYLDGEEVSLLCLVTGDNIIPMEPARDYKRIFDQDQGPNTGGVGCFSSSKLLPEKLRNTINKNILERIRLGLKEEGLGYKGILFIGLMIKENDPRVLEFNVRFGDPETQVLLPRLESDLGKLLLKSIDGGLKEEDLCWSQKECVTVIATSKGYPGDYEAGFPISGIERMDETIIPFHNGSRNEGGKLLTNGGRVLSITALGNTVEEARNIIYNNIKKISFEGMHYRKDIGK